MILLMARKHYTDQFRRQAVELYESTEGATLRGIAGDLGVAGGTLAQWVGALGTGTTTTPTGTSATPSSPPAGRTESQAAKLARLEARVRELEAEKVKHRTGDLEVGGEVFRRGDELVSRFQFVADHRTPSR